MTPIVVFTGRARSGKDSAAEFLCHEYRGIRLAFADPIKRFLMAVFGLTQEHLWGDKKEEEFTAEYKPSLLDFGLIEVLERAVGKTFKSFGDSEALTLHNRASRWLREYAPHGGKTTARRLMQTFGTEVVRAVLPDLWLEVGLRDAGRILQGGMTYLRTEGVIPVGAGKDVCYNLVCIGDGRFRNELLGTKMMGGWCVRIDRPIENGLSAEAKKHASEVEQSSIPDWWFDSIIENNGTLEGLQQQMSYFGRVRFGSPEKSL